MWWDCEIPLDVYFTIVKRACHVPPGLWLCPHTVCMYKEAHKYWAYERKKTEWTVPHQQLCHLNCRFCSVWRGRGIEKWVWKLVRSQHGSQILPFETIRATLSTIFKILSTALLWNKEQSSRKDFAIWQNHIAPWWWSYELQLTSRIQLSFRLLLLSIKRELLFLHRKKYLLLTHARNLYIYSHLFICSQTYTPPKVPLWS